MEAARRKWSGRGRRQEPGELAFYPWLLIAYPPISDLVAGHVRPAAPAALGVVAFAALYMLCIRLSFHGRRRAATVALAGLLVVIFLLLAGPAQNWFYLAPLMTIACGVVLRGRSVYLLLTVLTLALTVVMWRAGASWESISLATWGTTTGGLVVSVVLKLFSVITELQETREELARVAVAEERLRFSRDLHDLLGHTLSVMVVKAEAVRRLAPRDAEAAVRQAVDIEAVGREALTEVRAAVSGYRGRGLAAELASARTVLADAGIAATVTVSEGRPAPEADALLGWAVREGVTNVVRHSAARTCAITLEGTVLEIRDDGRGAEADASGNGLRGLAERVVALGGTLETVGRDGFLLRVTLP
ncbi:histidine kinase [Streptosporangium sp. NBC_01755]|uniref:sensor histidine kinase n=1 Tax=unclassified Streptosporangium TaxID=2632669 RepID=UPI002DD9863F|nr:MULTISPECIES: histidine kinase [unclassified Streptosporangium]WSA28885.1 histidine kinase [Streptosporangium sp. NBC_01810]WSC99669.1 histidine kinase [Streptosporangium sp. NBC_01755]